MLGLCFSNSASWFLLYCIKKHVQNTLKPFWPFHSNFIACIMVSQLRAARKSGWWNKKAKDIAIHRAIFFKLSTGKVHTVHVNDWSFLLFSFNDDTNLEVTRAIERGVQATAAFKEADPVLLERKYKWYGDVHTYSGIWNAKTFWRKQKWFKKLRAWELI